MPLHWKTPNTLLVAQLNSWKKQLEESNSQGGFVEKVLYDSRIHVFLSEGKLNLLVSVNSSEVFGYRFPCIDTGALTYCE